MLQVIAGASLRHQQVIASNTDLQQLLLSALAFKLHWAAAALSRAGLLPSSSADSCSCSGSGSIPLVSVSSVLVDIGSVSAASKWAAAAVEHANTHGGGTAGLLEPLVQACCAPLAAPAQCPNAEDLTATLVAQHAARSVLRPAAVALLCAAEQANCSKPTGQANAQRLAWAAVRLMPALLAATRRLLTEQPGPVLPPEGQLGAELLEPHTLLQPEQRSASDSSPTAEHAELLVHLQAVASGIAMAQSSPAQLPACAAATVAALQLLPLMPQLQLPEKLASAVAKCTTGLATVAARQAHDILQQPSTVCSLATAKQLCHAHTLACRLVHASISPTAEPGFLPFLGNKQAMLRLLWVGGAAAMQGLMHVPESLPGSTAWQERSRCADVNPQPHCPVQSTHLRDDLTPLIQVDAMVCRLVQALYASQMEALLGLGSVMSGRAMAEALDPDGAQKLLQAVCAFASCIPVVSARTALLVQLTASVAKQAVQQAVGAAAQQVS